MKITNRLQLKIGALLFLFFTSCNGVSQTNRDNTVSRVTNKQSSSLEESVETQVNPVLQEEKQLYLAQGHKEIRKLLGNDIGQMQFDTKAANDFRVYMANTLLTTSANSYNNSYGSSDYSSGSGSIQFCENGVFIEVLSGHISVDVAGASALSSGSNSMPGYWEVAALPNGTFIILLYSTHPSMLEDSANGFLPWVVPKHGKDFVSMPSGELYKRTEIQPCN